MIFFYLFIFFKGRHIGNKGASTLGEMLKISNSLTNIDISTNDITEVGARYILEGLLENNSVTQLDISGTHPLSF